MSAQPQPTPTAPDVRLLDDFSLSIAKLKVFATVLRSSDLTEGLDQDVLLGLECLLSDLIREFEGTFRHLEG